MVDHPRTKEDLEAELGGPIEVIQLTPSTCILINANARDLVLPKNRAASELWWEQHPVSGRGADFIYGPHILMDTNEMRKLDVLACTIKNPIPVDQRYLNVLTRNKPTFTPEEALQCSLDNPDACEACGS